MVKCKAKAIQTDLGTFRHNQAYSKSCVNLAYSQPWYIQNPDIFKTRNIFRTPLYLNCGIFKTKAYFRHLRWSILWKQLTENSFTTYKLATFSTSWNKYCEVVAPETVILCKKTLWRTRVPRTVKLWYTYWHVGIN